MKYILIALLFVYAVSAAPQDGVVDVQSAQWGGGFGGFGGSSCGGCSCSPTPCVSWMCQPRCMPTCCRRPSVIPMPVPVPVFVQCCNDRDTSCCQG